MSSLFDDPLELPEPAPKKQAGWRRPGVRYPQPATDRGSRRGAQRCIVTEALAILDQPVAKAAGIKGVFFQSRKEAKHYVYLELARRGGKLRPIAPNDKWRQVVFPLLAVNADGLKQRITSLRLDFAYELLVGDRWEARYEDVKPGGGFREDTYLLKRKWFEAQYGITIAEL